MALPDFPLPLTYFSGGAHIPEADSAALASILNSLYAKIGQANPPVLDSTPKTATFTPAVGTTYIVDPTALAFAVTLPTSAVNGDAIGFKNIADHANVVTINAGAGTTIEGYSGSALEPAAAGASTTLGGTANGRGFVLFKLVGTVWRIWNQG